MVEIVVRKSSNGFSKIFVAGKYCGEVEDVGDVDSIASVIRYILKFLKSCLTEEIKVSEEFY